ncbi:MAG: 30S ribosomal protein S3 [Erysipelotrichaceae bacterium]|nr:30S ribosomal protein S3 [Erysipelotrichaceae bacterium]MBR6725185.1 30S ribosomal protein S3 [Erysipelotrichaceae bacterium]
MGQKVSPIGLRIGVIRDWESRWYAEKEYGDLLLEDIKVRDYILKECADCLVSRVEIERSKNRVNLIIRTARPGMFVGSDGSKIEELKKNLVKLTGGKDININIVEVANPDLDARLVALKIVKMLEERQSFRTAQKRAIQQTMRSGAKGIKTAISGRLGGADIARSEGYSEGSVSLHTLRSDIDYAWEEAMTAYGKLGVKVWICRGEVLPGEMVKEPERPKSMGRPQRDRRPRRDFRRQENNAEAAAPAAEAPAAPETTKEDAE